MSLKMSSNKIFAFWSQTVWERCANWTGRAREAQPRNFFTARAFWYDPYFYWSKLCLCIQIFTFLTWKQIMVFWALLRRKILNPTFRNPQALCHPKKTEGIPETEQAQGFQPYWLSVPSDDLGAEPKYTLQLKMKSFQSPASKKLNLWPSM